MASINIQLPEDVLKKISNMGDRFDEVAEKALNSVAKQAENTAKSYLRASLSADPKNVKRRTDRLMNALGASPVKKDFKGVVNLKIGFVDGTPDHNNSKIANVIEYGRSDRPPRPFMKPAKNAIRKQIETELGEFIKSELTK